MEERICIVIAYYGCQGAHCQRIYTDLMKRYFTCLLFFIVVVDCCLLLRLSVSSLY